MSISAIVCLLALAQAAAEPAAQDATQLEIPLPPLPNDVEPTTSAPPEPVETVEAPPPEVDPERWPGEKRRVRFGVGTRLHAGILLQQGSPSLVLQSEVLGALSIRVRAHDELRIQFGIALGYPDIAGGESSVTYRHHLNLRWSIGVGGFIYWGVPSLRGGIEVPIAFRLGATRRHEISVALRVNGGIYNASSFVWWDFKRQLPAFGAEAAIGYVFIF